METLGALDVDGLNVGVETLLGTLLVVTLAGDADTETEGNTLDTSLPDLLVQGGVNTDILGALFREKEITSQLTGVARVYTGVLERVVRTYHGLLGESTDLLDSTGSTLLEADTVAL